MVITMRKNQRGAVVLSLSIIFLLLTTFVTLYVSKSILIEQKIVNNEMRSKLAFEAAEYGLSAAMQYISEGADRDENGFVDNIFNVDGTVANNIKVSDVGNESVEVEVDNLSDMVAFRITSQGFSDDRAATRTITQVVKLLDPLPNAPDNPLTTRGTVDVNGSATVHNPEGHSTIWSGGDVDVGSNNATATFIADPSDTPSYPGCMDNPMTCNTAQTSNKVTMGLDIIEHDNNLGNLTQSQMFENFFGMTPEKYREVIVDLDLAANSDFSAGANLAQNKVIWYDGDADINGVTVGCSSAVNGGNVCPQANEKPSIVIINGDATMKGGPHFYGVVFVMGDVTLSGNSTFHGALIVGGKANSTSGSLDVWYNSRLLEGIQPPGTAAAASGAWRDF